MELLSIAVTLIRVYWPVILVSGLFGRLVHNYLKLRHVPGPFVAAISDLWRVMHTLRGNTMKEYELHRKYNSPILRFGPNTVSVADPTAIKLIYGLNPVLNKVWK